MLNPINNYARTKYESEKVLKKFSKNLIINMEY